MATRRHKMQPFCTKWGSIFKNSSKIAILKRPAQPLRTKGDSIGKTEVTLRFSSVGRNVFAKKRNSIGKNWCKIAILKLPLQHFCPKWSLIGKKNCNFQVSLATLSHERRLDSGWIGKNWCNIAILKRPAQPFLREMKFHRQKLK